MRPLSTSFGDCVLGQAVAAVETIREQRHDVAAEGESASVDDRRRRDAVAVVVAEHGDAFASTDGRSEPVACRGAIGHGVGSGQASEPRIEKAASRVRIAMAAAQQQVGERDGHPERVGEDSRFAPRPSRQVGGVGQSRRRRAAANSTVGQPRRRPGSASRSGEWLPRFVCFPR